MATGLRRATPASAPPRALRMTGSSLAPRWRGRLHLWALVLAVPASVALVDRRPTAPVVAYAVALVALYACSAAYHLAPVTTSTRHLLRRVDHVMIYLFTAASYVPFCAQVVPEPLGRVVLVLVWAGAVGSGALKAVGFARVRAIGSVLYLLLGWLVVVTLPSALTRLGGAEVALLVVTGALYTCGAATLFWRRPDPRPEVFGYHEVWHACVVVASGCYFVLVWDLVGR